MRETINFRQCSYPSGSKPLAVGFILSDISTNTKLVENQNTLLEQNKMQGSELKKRMSELEEQKNELEEQKEMLETLQRQQEQLVEQLKQSAMDVACCAKSLNGPLRQLVQRQALVVAALSK